MNALLIDTDLAALAAFGRQLGRDGRLSEISYCSDPAVALRQIRQTRPDVVFLAVRFHCSTPEHSLAATAAAAPASGIALARRIRHNFPLIHLIFLATETSDAYAAFQCFPLTYLCKPVKMKQLRSVIDRLFQFGTYPGETGKVGKILINNFNMTSSVKATADSLGTKQIAKQITKQIADVKNQQTSCLSAYRLRCFGNYEIIQPQDPDRSVKFPTRLSKEILAFLIINNDRTVSRAEIMGCLLPKRTNARAVNLFHVNLYKLRRFLEQHQYILGDISINERYRLRLPNGVCDLVDYTRFVRSQTKLTEKTINDAELYASLWRGPCFAAEDYPWSDDLRAELEVAQENLLLQIADFRWQQNEPGLSEAALKSLISLNPLSEEGHCYLLDQYLQQQERRKYIREFEHYRQIMHDELDVAVAGRYQKAYQQLKS